MEGAEGGAPASADGSQRWALALHGGAGTISRSVPEERRQEYLKGLRAALDVGSRLLALGGMLFYHILFIIFNIIFKIK
jgi:beta-aspartyl-peptidase (threonine type)